MMKLSKKTPLPTGKPLWNLLLCLAALILVAGCAETKPDWHPATGTVTSNGVPVPVAEVVFYSVDSSFARIAETDQSGQFECKTHIANGLPVGEYKVVVRPIFVDPVLKGDWDPEKEILPMNRKDIPKKFHSKETTPITITVQETVNSIDIKLD